MPPSAEGADRPARRDSRRAARRRAGDRGAGGPSSAAHPSPRHGACGAAQRRCGFTSTPARRSPELDLVPGRWTVGGGANDGVRIGGLAPAFLNWPSPRCGVARGERAGSGWAEGRSMPGPGGSSSPARRWSSRQRDAFVCHLCDRPERVRCSAPSPRASGRSHPCAASVLVAVAGPDAGASFPRLGDRGARAAGALRNPPSRPGGVPPPAAAGARPRRNSGRSAPGKKSRAAQREATPRTGGAPRG